MNRSKSRKLNRWQGHDYSENGYYFVTICTKGRISWFGEIVKGQIKLSDIGKYVLECWNEIPNHCTDVKILEKTIMPNHFHCILFIDRPNVGNKNLCSLQKEIIWQKKWAKTLSSAIRGFKIGVTKWCRTNGYSDFSWQKSYHDHVIHSDKEYYEIAEYIENNPLNWNKDEYF